MASLLVLLMAVAIKGVYTCDLDTSGSSIIWTSTNYPSPYPADDICTLALPTAAAPVARTLIFNDLALERKRQGKCKDYVGVFSPDRQYSHQICRPKYTKYIVPTTKAVMGFTSSSKVHSRGFNITVAEYTSPCHKVIDMETLNITSGYIMSPNFPRRFNRMDRCEWWIKAPSVKTIKVHVTTMRMRYSKECRKSYVAVDVIGDHLFQYNPAEPITKICGKETKIITGKIGKEVGIVFYGGRRRAKGFRAHYSLV